MDQHSVDYEEANRHCVFCRIATGASPSWKIDEDDEFLAFFDLYPIMEGQGLVIPKRHIDSYAFAMDDPAYSRLMLKTKTVGQILDGALGSQRCIMVMAGLEINHVHIKLFPIYHLPSWAFKRRPDTRVGEGLPIFRHGAMATPDELSALEARVAAYKAERARRSA